MSDYHKLLAVVQNNNLDDKERNAALAKLIENGAVEQLNQVVCDKKRSREMHDVASRAIFEILQGHAAEIKDYGRLVNIEWSSIKSEGSDQIPAAQSGDARKAAEIALTMVEDYPNNHHPDERRYQALYALINGGHTEMLKRIVENPKIFKKWREEARTYLKQARR